MTIIIITIMITTTAISKGHFRAAFSTEAQGAPQNIHSAVSSCSTVLDAEGTARKHTTNKERAVMKTDHQGMRNKTINLY